MKTRKYSYREYVSCKSKKTYTSIERLKEAAKRLSYRFGDMIPVHGYVCPFCGKYHLTTRDSVKNQKFDDRIF